MGENPYLTGLYAPTTTETDAELDVVEGSIPDDLEGMYVRNGPNPAFTATGRHHWFDGDGMLHAVHFGGGSARYRNRWIQTDGFRQEREAGHALWTGLLESTANNPERAPYKDTANTDVIAHNGWLLATWYICGAAHRVNPLDLTTDGPATFGRDRPLRLSAHAKVDPRSGELLFFDYGLRAPFMRCGVVSPDGELEHRADIDLPGPRLPHDMAVTERFMILMDLPVYPRPEALKKRRWMIDYHRDEPARFGIVPRRGEGAAIRWFEAEPCYVYHSINAWEDGNKVVMVGCRCTDPTPTPDPNDGELARAMANLRLSAEVYRWTFDLDTGAVHEERLDDRNAEFPTIDDRRLGIENRFAYAMTIPKTSTLAFDGIAKYDLRDGSSQRLAFGAGRLGSEAPFAPRGEGEDEGYLLSFVNGEDGSELWIIDAEQIERGPVARLRIPQHVPLGFHSCWVPPAELGRAKRREAT